MAEDTEIEESEETGTPDQFVGRDLLESYIYYCNYVPSNPLERYNILVKSVTFGMELLPYYFDPDETDEDRIQINIEKQNVADEIYANAKKVLKAEVPAKREIVYDYVDIGGERYMLYKINASENKDAKPCQAMQKELGKVLNNFITQQHEQHIPNLQEAHNQILHELTQVGIVPSINPTLDQMIKAEIKSLHQEVTEAMIEKQLEEEDKDGKGKRKI